MRRHVLLALSVLACLLLVLGEVSDLNAIEIGQTSRAGQAVYENDSFALTVIALVAALMAYGAWWMHAQEAAWAVAALGAMAVLIVIGVHAPDVDATGSLPDRYESVTAEAARGFYLVSAGAVLLLFSGVLTAVTTRAGGPAPAASAPRERPSRS